ncbi:hypothetical protein BGX26_002695 [Mortierella sp. AD094]|nr:hypothetical protein BGX26_002695 [Mortierella sp. AD094]
MASQSIIDLNLSPSMSDFLDEGELDSPDHCELDGGEHNNFVLEDGITNEISEAVKTESGDIIQSSSVVRSPHPSDSSDCETTETKATQQDEGSHRPLQSSPFTRHDESDRLENYEGSIHSRSPSPSSPRLAYKDHESEYEGEDSRHSSASVTPSSEGSPSPEQRHQYRQHRQIQTSFTDDHEEEEQEEVQKEIPISTDVHRNTSSNRLDENSDIAGTSYKESDSCGSQGTESGVISRGIKRKLSIEDPVSSGVKLGRVTSECQQDSRHSQKPREKEDSKVGVIHGPDNSRATTFRNVTLTRSSEFDLTTSRLQQAHDVNCINESERSSPPDRRTLMNASNRPNDWSHNQNHGHANFFNSLNVTRAFQDQLLRMHSHNNSALYPSIDSQFLRSWAFSALSQLKQRPVFPLFNASVDTPPLDFLVQFATYEIEALSQHLLREQNAHLRTQQERGDLRLQLKDLEIKCTRLREERDELKLQLRDLELQYTRLFQRLTRAERRD